MRGGTPGAAGMAVILASLVGVALAATGDVVEESRFVKGAEGWTITVDGKGAADGQAQHERGMKRIKGGDTGDVTWYFTAPEKYLGDQRKFYHASLNYTLGHYVYDGISGGVDSGVADIVLESKQKKLRLGAKHIFKQGQGQASYSVAFTAYPLSHTCKGGPNTAECAGAGATCIRSSDCCSRQCVPGDDAWYNLKTGKRATNIEMLDALTAVSALKIRGGYFPGGVEKTWLHAPTIREGSQFNVTETTNEEQQPLTPSTPRRTDSQCIRPQMGFIKLHPPAHVESSAFNIVQRRPWRTQYTIENIPPICSDVTLIVEAKGDLVGMDKWVSIATGDGRELGQLFKYEGDGGIISTACPQDEGGSCLAGGGKNGSVFMAQDHVTQSVNRDGIVLPRALAVVLAATGSFSFYLYVDDNRGNAAEEVEIHSISLSFPLGGCYTYRAIGFPGWGPYPARRYSGYTTSLSFPSPPLPEDGGALWVNATGILGPRAITLESKYGDFIAIYGDPGPWGPSYVFTPEPSGGSDSGGGVLSATGVSAPMPHASTLFGGSFGEGAPFSSRTYDEAGYLTRAGLEAAVSSLPSSSPLSLSLFLSGTPDGSSHPGDLTINAAGIVYPPKSCFTSTIDDVGGGNKPEGFRGRPINRFLEYCTDRWQCESEYLSNGLIFEGKDACEKACIAQPGNIKGKCFQPFVPVGACTDPTHSCNCATSSSMAGQPYCLDTNGDRLTPTGSCQCNIDRWCDRTYMNVSLGYRFGDLPAPSGDVLIYVTAMMPYPFKADNWLRFRLVEGDERVLGYAFSSPDCSSEDCRRPYTLNDGTTPLIDTIRVPYSQAIGLLSDRVLEFAVEIDAPRQAITCTLHTDHERCFPGLSNAEINKRIYPSDAQTTLAAALDDSSTTFSVDSASAAGIVPDVYIKIGDELMLVTAVSTNALTVERGALASVPASHVVGVCTCTSHLAACEGAASYAACDAATPDKNSADLPLPVPWAPTAVRVVNKIVLPGLDNTSGEVSLKSIMISYATASE